MLGLESHLGEPGVTPDLLATLQTRRHPPDIDGQAERAGSRAVLAEGMAVGVGTIF